MAAARMATASAPKSTAADTLGISGMRTTTAEEPIDAWTVIARHAVAVSVSVLSGGTTPDTALFAEISMVDSILIAVLVLGSAMLGARMWADP